MPTAARLIRAGAGLVGLAVITAMAVSGCAAPAAAPPADCPPQLIEFYETIGAPQTDTPDPALYPERAPTPSCSFYFEPQDSTSVVIAQAERADFDAVYAALKDFGYDIGEPIENATPAAGDAHVRADLNGGPATGVVMLVEPDPTAGFDSMSVVFLAVPVP